MIRVTIPVMIKVQIIFPIPTLKISPGDNK
jgi:hypothetical protein